MWIIHSLALGVVFAMNRCPLLSDHPRCQPEPKTEKMGHDGMQVQSAVRLAAMQKDGDASNSDVGSYQRKNEDLPPSPI